MSDSANNKLLTAAVRPSDGMLIFLASLGDVYVGLRGDTSPQRISAAAPAVGVAFAGEQAVILLEAEGGGHTLQVLNDRFEPTTEFEVAGLTRCFDAGWRYVLSASADATWVSITADHTRGADVPSGVLVNTADGRSLIFDAFRCYFVSDRALVGKLVQSDYGAGDPGVLLLFEVGLEDVAVAGEIRGPQEILASDAQTGVFISLETPALGGTSSQVGLRTVDAGPDIVNEGSYTNLSEVTTLLLPTSD